MNTAFNWEYYLTSPYLWATVIVVALAFGVWQWTRLNRKDEE